MVTTDLYRDAVGKYGKEHQLLVTAGELAECAAEIARHMIPDREHDEQDLIDELADVSIMLGQMEVIYGEQLTNAIFKKLNKQRKHIEEDSYDIQQQSN